jgi:Holliday junction resolvase RusA-like endonuclease
MEQQIVIELAHLPPSLNGAYPTVMTGRGMIRRALSPEAKAWKAEAIPLMRNAVQQSDWQPRPKTPLRVAVWYCSPTIYHYDLDGKVKLLSDALAEALGVDDRYVVEWQLRKSRAKEQRVLIYVRPWRDADGAPLWMRLDQGASL